MFGEYAQIATYVQREAFNQNDIYGADPMPPYLRPSFSMPQFMGPRKDKSGLVEDFIMVAEFSELEGPKPVMTIPKDVATSFDQNSFAVKILAVDHQHSAEGFTVTEDAQVVYTDSELGVYAFVHHLVLFDNTARGFVRPYCVAFITGQQSSKKSSFRQSGKSVDPRKIMHFYEEISWELKKAARYLKYGNRMVFVSDLERHLKDLDHTKGFLLNQVSKMRLKDSDNGDGIQDIRKNAEAELYKGLQTIRQSNLEIMEILSILKPLLSDRKLEARFKVLEERAFQNSSRCGADNLSLQENWYNDLSSLDGLESRCGSLNEPRLSPLTLFKPKEYKPRLVETKKAKRFNSALRGLHELCSWGAKEGLKKLRNIHECFKRDMMLLLLDRNESQLKNPSAAVICHADCMTGNFLTGTFSNAFETDFNPDENTNTMYPKGLKAFGSFGSFDSFESFKSVDSQSLSLVTWQEGSPSSTRTNDSQFGNKFESAPSSPRVNDISLLMENEYYSDLETPQNEVPIFYQDTTSSSSDMSSWSDASASRRGGSKKPGLDIKRPGMEIKKNLAFSPESDRGTTGSEKDFRESSEYVEETAHKKGTFDADKTPCRDRETFPTLSNSVEQTIDLHTSEGDDKDYSVSWSPNNYTSPIVYDPSQGNVPTPTPETYSDCLSGRTIVDETNFPGSGGNTDIPQDGSLSSRKNSNVSSTSLTEVEASFTGSLQCSTPRPHAPFPQTLGATQRTQRPGQLSMHNVSSKEDVSEPNKGMRSVDSTLGLSHHLVSLGPIKYCTDSDESSGFTEVTSQDLLNEVTMQDLYLQGSDNLSSSFKDALSSHNDGPEDTDRSDEYVNISPPELPSPWRPKGGLLSVGDWVNNVGNGRPGFNLLDVLNTYQNLQHVIASLLTGRPVLVAGPSRCEAEVSSIVNALSVFIGAVRRKRQHAVLEWTTKPPRIPDLTRLRLVGVCRPDRRSLEYFIPAAVRQTCTIMDVERKIITAPLYQGHFVTSLLQRKKSFKANAQLMAYLQWWLMDIAGKAFLFYHSFCLGSIGSIFYSQSAIDQRDGYLNALSNELSRIGVTDSDSDILEQVTEMVKLSQLEENNSGAVPIPLHLHHKVCQTFRC